MNRIASILISAALGGLIVAVIFMVTLAWRGHEAGEGNASAWYGAPFDGRLNSTEKSALLGDKESSLKLLNDIASCSSPNTQEDSPKNCAKKQNYWQMVDAENGGSLGASAVYITLSSSRNCADIVRSVYWAEKMEKLGDKDGIAKSEVERLKQKSSTC